jgi:hypothetical protein
LFKLKRIFNWSELINKKAQKFVKSGLISTIIVTA